MRTNRWLGVGAALVAAAVVLSGCSNPAGAEDTQAAAGEPQYGGDLVVGLYLEPLALDPHRQGYWETYRVSNNIFEGLTREDTTDTTGPTEIQPALATDWSVSDDGTTWTFDLRDGVTFHDGSDWNAEALDKNVRRISDPTYEFYDESSAAKLKQWFGTLTSGTVVDDDTYQFAFSKPFLGFPRILAQSMATLTIGNPAVWEQYGNDGFADHPEGTGPYKFVSRTVGDRIELEKNEEYWGDEPYVDTITFRIIPNNQTRLASLLSGELDLISYVQPEDVETLEAQGFQVPEGTGSSLLYISYNFTNPAFEDVRVRQALIHGLDRQKLADELYNGYAEPQYSFQPPGNEAYDPEVRDFEYDPEKAIALLEEAGYGEGDLAFTIVVDVANQNTAEWLQSQYKEIGVDVEIVSLDRTSYIARAYGPEENDGLSLDEYGGTYAEWLSQGFAGLAGKGLDPADFPEITGAIDAAASTADPDARIDLWKSAEETLRNEAVVIPTVNLTRYYALGSNVEGFVWPATNWYDLSKVWLAD
ncbi:ABC transporter substrate-binding protein [Herbiconiux sp. CPCC 203407]|uniref:ABC transporter substrate-binding protein n=1 Tax=Herbiconiux oxytropis TaxID=2970915 RepID=A0AA41XCP5_9MICO|nr:ABC transporter substrate-binding protein [Herbiconiux oxytropis]MCS5722175.1 ABC transporter substrate-binding protein [Herbiconiux oxytropis]MCS5725757.1 ABC transporter substrate-binding protein [Herbiconiux oxytropis]